MYKKFIKKSTIFVLIFCIITPILGRFLTDGKNSTMDGFYYEEKNNLDVLFFGSSQMYCTIIPNVIWEKTGITNYNLAQPEQPMWLTYHYMKEALKYQKPSVVFMDVLTVNMEEEYMPMANSNINLDALKMSKNKLEAIEVSVPKEERPYFLFNLLQNKSNWKNISSANFIDNFENTKNDNKGFLEFYQVNTYDVPTAHKTDDIGILPSKPEEYLQKIIDLFEEEDIELVLIKAPYELTKEHQKKYNKVAQIAKENNVEFIDFNQMYGELGIDFKTDMLDSYHLNLRGARKVSEYMANYLQENYDLENKQNDDKYIQWNKDAEVWARKEKAFELSQEKEIKSYFEKIKLKDSNYIVAMTYNDDKKSYYKLVDGKKVIDEKDGDNTLVSSMNIEGINIDINFANGSSIKVNEEEFSKNSKGLNVVIYDTILKRVVDNSNINFSDEIELTR